MHGCGLTTLIKVTFDLICEVVEADSLNQFKQPAIPSVLIATLAMYYVIFSARCNIYISRLCYDVSVRLSVCDGSELAHYS